MGKWEVFLSVDGRRRRLGYFDDLNEAGDAYETEIKRIYGDLFVPVIDSNQRRPRRPIPHPTDATLALVPLTMGHFAVISSVDSGDVGLLIWSARVTPHTVYATSHIPGGKRGSGERIDLHVFVGRLMGLKLEAEVDHKDGDGLNCRRSNLRDATPGQNQQNKRMSKANTSGIKGVYWNRRFRKWVAQLRINGRSTYLGGFSDPGAASDAVVAARELAHGEFANHGGTS